MKMRKRNIKFKFLDDMGLVVSNGAMVYGWKHGWFRWAPEWFKYGVAGIWNNTHCAFAGHDPFGQEAYLNHAVPGPPVCTNCCARLKIGGRYPTSEEIEIHNELCYKGWEEAEAKWRLEHPEEAAENDRQIAEELLGEE